MDPGVLLDDFNFYRARTHHFQKLRAEHPYMRLPKLSREKARLLTGMVEWCRTHGLEPRHWLYCLFARNRWLYAPKWTAGFLTSPAGLKWYRAKAKTVDDRLFRERIAQTHAIQQSAAGNSPVYDPNVHLSAEVEARKLRLAQRGDHAECMATVNETLGYHPKSKVCGLCPVRVGCADKIRGMFAFDIVALREGRLTVQQATLAAVVQRGRP